MTGVINGQEFGMATLNISVLQQGSSEAPTIWSSISQVPASVGPLMRVLVVTIAPIYWALARESGEALNGYSLTGGSFQQESQMEFSTGELLTMTQVARGLDPDGLLLVDMKINGMIPESLADGDLRVQDFQEHYVQTGPGQLFAGSTQRFLHDSLPASLRCNHSIQYDETRGLQPQLVQHLRASSISSAFDPEAEALNFQLTTALQTEENEVGCPEGFEPDVQGAFCVDKDECSGGPSPCSHTCRNAPGHFSCSCPTGFSLAWDHRNCRDINECEEDGIECGPGQMCFNTRGSFQCVDTPCPTTYRQGSSPGTCFRRCSQDCSASGPSTLQYRLLPLPLGVRAHHDVARLAAFSEAGIPANRTELTVLEPDPRSPFALRQLRAGQGAVYTRRALTRAGLYRLTVRAAAPRHQSVYILLIAVSPYPY